MKVASIIDNDPEATLAQYNFTRVQISSNSWRIIRIVTKSQEGMRKYRNSQKDVHVDGEIIVKEVSPVHIPLPMPAS